MLVVMSHGASASEIGRVVDTIRELGYEARPIPGKDRTAIGLVGNDGNVDSGRLEALPGVLQVIHVTQPYKQVSREWREEPTIIELFNGTRIGGEDVVLMAGPCSVESKEQILGIAHRLKAAGATVLRGGAFKPRTSPYAWQGLGIAGLELLSLAREQTGLAIVTEALETETVEAVAEHADIIQIGARNMQNYPLLRRAGRTGRPVLLKRGMAATIRELLLSAEYILAEGNPNVILCERGIRSFDDQTRNLFDLTAIPVVKGLSHLPIIADPSHGTGVRAKVIPMARAAIAAGGDGLMIEVHPDPDHARSDGAQSLWPDQFEELVAQVGLIAEAIGRRLAPVGKIVAKEPLTRV
ncbi:MAG: 3-deoxy-7-phosphoheptulonate synthase [Gemmatimonadota bacterium]